MRYQRTPRVRLEEVCVRGWRPLAVRASVLAQVRGNEAVQSEEAP